VRPDVDRLIVDAEGVLEGTQIGESCSSTFWSTMKPDQREADLPVACQDVLVVLLPCHWVG
jgi:hypothetical protein